jgi:hypothetical protein
LLSRRRFESDDICRIFKVPPHMIGLRPQRLYILTVIPARPRRQDEGLTFKVEILAKSGLAAVNRFLHYAPGCAVTNIQRAPKPKPETGGFLVPSTFTLRGISLWQK